MVNNSSNFNKANDHLSPSLLYLLQIHHCPSFVDFRLLITPLVLFKLLLCLPCFFIVCKIYIPCVEKENLKWPTHAYPLVVL
jgi:hypothetical protein